MVIDHLKNASCYYGLNARFKRAFDFLREKDFSKMDPGKYEIDGLDIYALVATYKTKPKDEGTWEAHMPGLTANGPQAVKKIIVKVRLD